MPVRKVRMRRAAGRMRGTRVKDALDWGRREREAKERKSFEELQRTLDASDTGSYVELVEAALSECPRVSVFAEPAEVPVGSISCRLCRILVASPRGLSRHLSARHWAGRTKVDRLMRSTDKAITDADVQAMKCKCAHTLWWHFGNDVCLYEGCDCQQFDHNFAKRDGGQDPLDNATLISLDETVMQRSYRGKRGAVTRGGLVASEEYAYADSYSWTDGDLVNGIPLRRISKLLDEQDAYDTADGRCIGTSYEGYAFHNSVAVSCFQDDYWRFRQMGYIGGSKHRMVA